MYLVKKLYRREYEFLACGSKNDCIKFAKKYAEEFGGLITCGLGGDLDIWTNKLTARVLQNGWAVHGLHLENNKIITGR